MFGFIAWLFLLWNKDVTNAGEKQYLLTVNTWDVKHDLQHFWTSTGFCPPLPHEKAYDFDFGRDMKHNLALISSVAHGGIKQVRIHWLLDLVSVKTVKNDGNLIYNYSKLDDFLIYLFQNDLKPGFELMGNPSGYFTDFENKTQVYAWRDLIKDTAEYLVDEYGISEVMTWNFESWNEPDCHDFDKVKMTVQGFLNYYDACSEGLKTASPLLKFGGPGAGCDRPGHDNYATALLQHVVEGQNYFTRQKGVRIDFLSYHRKGNGSSKNIIESEIDTFKQIIMKYPSLKNISFVNDEADPMVGWSKDLLWRADTTYAAMATKVIGQHQNMIISNPQSVISNYSLLSNDNAFLSWYPHQFTERTLTARFQMNNTKPPHVQFIKKPIFTVMSLLSLLGEKQLTTTFTEVLNNGSSIPVPANSDVGVLASLHYYDHIGTSESWHGSVLVYSSQDTNSEPGDIITVNLTMGLDPPYPNGSIVNVIGYSLNNNETTNPYLIWKKLGSPDFPSDEQFQKMRQAEEPKRIFNDTIIYFNPFYHKTFKLAAPEVVLVHFCVLADTPPDQVTNLAVRNVTAGKVLITWSDGCVHSKCIVTYEVIFQPIKSAVVMRINTYDIISTSFYFTPGNNDESVWGTYFVRAVDYGGRYGTNSLPFKYGKL